MSVVQPSSTIDRIDEGLRNYYKKLKTDYNIETDDGTVGKFKFFVDESGFDEDGIDDELNQKADECTIVEFDVDDDGNNLFPLDPAIDDEDKRNIEIHRILNDIAKYGAPKEAVEAMKLTIDICADLKDTELEQFTSNYMNQMSSLDKVQGKDGDLKWFLAVGKKQKYPFLTYMVDSFTKEKAEHHWKCANDAENTAAPLTVAVWAQKNKFFIALKRKYPQKANQLQSAMINYSNRIMNRLQFQPVFKINDNLMEIVQYVVSIPQFVKTLIDNESSVALPPFQVDLLIAVNEVQAQFSGHDDGDPNDDDDSDDDKDDMDPKKDHIGFIQEEFKKIPIYYAPPNDQFEIGNEEEKEKMEAITRVLGQRYNDFRTVLGGNGGSLEDDKKENKNAPNKASKYFDANTYPNRRRFSIFIDRRKEKPTKAERDEMTFFEPPSDCNKFGNDHVPEIGFEFLRQCILPRSTKHVAATDGLCGQLMTFMFNVEAKDEIKCYIVWNGQTMRFHGDHISKILPNIFIETDENTKFMESKEPKKLQDLFEQHMDDRKFAKFYMALKNFES